MKKWMTKRVLSVLLSVTVTVGTGVIPAQAVSDTGNPEQENTLCPHHQEHTAECGYAMSMPCTHEHNGECYLTTEECVHIHTEECYPDDIADEDSVPERSATPSDAQSREPENCPHVCSRESGCITEKLDCRHEHDSECGYVPGIPCSYLCAECGKAENRQDEELQEEIPEGPQKEQPEEPQEEQPEGSQKEQPEGSQEGPLEEQQKEQPEEPQEEQPEGPQEEQQEERPEEQQKEQPEELPEELSAQPDSRIMPRTTEIASGDLGSRFHWMLDENGTLTVEGTGNMPYAGSSDALWHNYENDIVEAVIAEGITSIGESAFENCRSLERIELPDSITSIGDFAFYGCESLELDELPPDVASIGRWAFNDCISLALTKLPDGITVIRNYAFSGCISLALSELPAGLTSIEHHGFFGCYRLTLTELPASVVSIGYYAFFDCTGLALTKLPDGITSIEDSAFMRCRNLALTELPAGLNSIGDRAFDGCEKLALAELPDSVNSIGDSAFYGCKNLTLTKLPDQVTSIGINTFVYCENLALTELPDGITSIEVQAFYGCKSLALTKLPDSVTSIEDSAFMLCTSLALTELPAGITSIGHHAFYGCESLTEIAFTGSTAPSLGVNAFDDCTSLEVIYIPAGATGYDGANWPADKIKTMAAPSFTGQPQNVTVAAGQTAAFTVTVSGGLVSAYQWQVNKGSGWEDIPGAADRSYTTGAADKRMDGWKYRCVASNSVGGAVSDEAVLTVKSTDTSVQAVLVDGTAGVISGTSIMVVLPYGKALPTDKGKVDITPAEGAAVSSLAAEDGGATWTFTVTAEDGVTMASYAITVSNAPNPAAANIMDVAAVKSTIESKIWIMGQSAANTESAVKAWIDSQIAAMDVNGVKCEVSITGFTAAIAGSEDNTEGMDGAFTFTVSLSKGENDTLAEATATGINGAITAAPYSAQEYLVSVSASPAAGGIVSGGGTYAENTSAVVTAAAKAGYHFVRWTEGGSEVSTSKSYTFTIIGNRILVAVFEKNGGSGGSSGGGGSSSGGSSGGGGSSSGGSSGGGGNSYNDKPKIPAVGQTEPIMPDAGGNAKVDNGAVQSAVSAVKNDAGRDGDLANGVAVTIPVTPGAGQASWNVAITGQTLDTLVREDVKRLEIVIEGMIIEGINADLLKWLNTVSTGGDIILRIKRTDLPGSSEARSAIGTRPAYNLSMVYLSDGKETQIDDFGGHTISIRLPYIPAKGEQAGSLYAVCVDGAGKVDWIINSSYHPDLGAVIFETGHFSVYGVACKDDVPAFTDIADHWAADNIIVCILGLKPSPSRRNL